MTIKNSEPDTHKYKMSDGKDTLTHTERPDVRLAAELAVFDDLWSRPLDRELGAQGACVLIIKHKSIVQRAETPLHSSLTSVKNIVKISHNT